MRPISCNSDPAQPFEQLRLWAEADTAGRTKMRRPSWARAVTVDGELLDVCIALGLLEDGDRPIARLWACFTDPRIEHACHGFELCAGTARGKADNQIWQISRTAFGWRCGELLSSYWIDKQVAYRETHAVEQHDDELQQAAANFCLRLQAHELAAELVADFIEFLELERAR